MREVSPHAEKSLKNAYVDGASELNQRKVLEVALTKAETNLRILVARQAAGKENQNNEVELEKARSLCRQTRGALNQYINQAGVWIG